jgi:hypothetical protein
MPITFRIDAESGVVYTNVQGLVSADDILEALKSIMGHPEFRPGLNGLADLRNIEGDLFSGDVRKIAELMIEFRKKIGSSKTAVIVSKDVTFGMARTYQVFAEKSSIKTEIFRDKDEALQWLGIARRQAE